MLYLFNAKMLECVNAKINKYFNFEVVV